MKKIHITTLGCPKNVVDSEVMMGQLEHNLCTITDDPENADVIIINTCGFIEDSKKESIQAIFEALKLKEQDPTKKVLISGCLSQRYRNELAQEIPEVDGIFGTEDFNAILQSLGKTRTSVDNLHRLRRLTTLGHYAYLKISEGCNHTCAFCAIPAIRGEHRSRPLESLVEEAHRLSDLGVKELILISQDTSYYGKDIYDKQRIVDLLEKLHAIKGIEWIRVLYWYPTNFPHEVLDMMKTSDKLLPYIDMPLQHISDRMLRIMRRGDTSSSIRKLMTKIRGQFPEITLRTTMIVGHPGEMEDDFNELLRFVAEMEFDRLGSFIYSDEEGTASFDLTKKISKTTATRRQTLLMEQQQQISLRKNQALVGQRIKVLLDEYLTDSQTFIGRSYRDAPEIDNEVIISIKQMDVSPKPGDFTEVIIDDASEYELYGKFF